MSRWKFTVSDNRTGQEVATVESTAPALWDAQDYGASLPDTPSRGSRADYAWLYFAAKRQGCLGNLGLTNETEVEEAVEALAERYDYRMEKVQAAVPFEPRE